MAVARMNERGALTIPKDIREHLGLADGQAFLVSVAEDGTIRLRPIRPKRSLREFLGVFRPSEQFKSFEDEERSAEEKAAADAVTSEVMHR